MQGTIAVLMAFSGLGCHHKSCAPVVMESCYSSGYGACYSSGYGACYASAPIMAEVVVPTSQAYPMAQSYPAAQGYPVAATYGACYASTGYSSCYGGGHGGWDSCYGSTCYGTPRKKHGLFGGGLFGHKRRARPVDACCGLGTVDAGYSACYSMPVYGSYTPAYSTSYPSGQGVIYGAPQYGTSQYGASPLAAPTTTGGAMTAPTTATDATTGAAAPPATPSTPPADPKVDAPANPEAPKADAPAGGTPPPPPTPDAPKADPDKPGRS